MLKKILSLSLTLCLIVSACSKEVVELPEPDILYSAVEKAADLSEMIEFTPEELENLIGINPSDYVSFIAYQAGWGMSPDEIIIVRAVDESKADNIEKKLNDRVESKRKSFEVYLTENLPTVDEAVVRRDGLTISMLITQNIEAAEEAYNKLSE